MRNLPSLVALPFVALLALPSWAAAQNGTVTGRVIGIAMEALPGASVAVTGSGRHTLTRSDGTYSLTLPAGRYELRARMLGFAAVAESVTVSPGSTATADFALTRAATSLEAVAILGTRGEERTVISAPVPIDVLSLADIQLTGRTETAQIIQAVAPSFNFPRTSVGDGTDHIRPATLRGLAPDHSLVLINGKRRHTSALVNVNGFVGRGSQAVDLNAIPASMIDHIEILRDGAAAQYGSDAIAGVMNIVLKSNAPGSLTGQVGQNMTTYNRDATPTVAFPAQVGDRTIRDGKVASAAANYGLSIGDNGFVQLSGEVRDRQGTNRTLPDPRQQYFTGDPRNVNTPQINHWQGDSYNHDVSGFLNAGTTLENGIEVYGFGGIGRRHGVSAGFWRRPLDDRTVRSIYPDGFLPFIKSQIVDLSGSGGVKGEVSGWKWDLGTVYGQNAFDFTIDNSNNVSLGPTSPTKFDAGQLAAGQWTTTLDFFREIGTSMWTAPIRVAVGGEFRRDMYEISAGEPDSYRNGNVRVLDANGNPTTRLAAVGSQVFPGFQPSDAGSHSRTNSAAYVDLESDLTSKFLLGLAGRFENYSDFGSTTTGKIAARFAPMKQFALRGAVSTGFRAPSLGQSFFSSTATNFIAGQPFDIRTFPVATAEAKLLGASALTPEKSVNYSAGIALEPYRSLALTIDFYRIDITDRIVLSDNFTGATIQALFASTGSTAAGGRFFTNAIDTRSNGLDVVANYGVGFANKSMLRLTGGYNRNKVKVTRVDSTPANLAAFQENLFGRSERMRIERGNPQDNMFGSANYSLKGLALTGRVQRYGAVRVAGATATNATGPLDQTYNAKVVTDLSAGYTLRRYTATIGADNIFDVYPERNLNPGNPTTGNGGLSNFGIFPYAGISPFGFNGRFVYAKVAVTLP